MKNIFKIVSFIGLGLTIIPSILYFLSAIQLKTNFTLMVLGMVVYFGSAPFWMKSKPLEDEE